MQDRRNSSISSRILLSQRDLDGSRDPQKEQEILESKLTQLIGRCEELCALRKSRYISQEGGKDRRSLPIVNQRAVLPPIGAGLEGFRKHREDRLNELCEIPAPENFIVQGEVLKAEFEQASVKENDPKIVHAKLIKFFSSRKQVLVQKKYRHLFRWARFCSKTDVMEKVRPMLNARLNTVHAEYQDLSETLSRFRVDDRHNDVAEADNPDDFILRDTTTFSLGSDTSYQGPSEAALFDTIQASDLAYFLRWLVYHSKTFKRCQRFFTKFQWVTYSHRHELYRKSLEILQQTASTMNTAAMRTSDSFGLPMMTSTKEKLDSQLELLKHYFRLDFVNLDKVDEGQELLYYVNKLFSERYTRQVAAMFFPDYGVAAMFRPAASGSSSSDGSASSDRKDDKKDKDTVLPPSSRPTKPVSGPVTSRPDLPEITDTTTHLKPSKWIPFMKTEASMDPLQDLQKCKLVQIRKVDNALRIECGFIGSEDVQFVVRRLKEQAESHKERIGGPKRINDDFDDVKSSAPSEGHRSSMMSLLHKAGGSFISSVSAKTVDVQSLSKEVQGLVPNKLLSVYLLRFLRIRDLKRRLLRMLNYFRSVERKLTIDLVGFSMETRPLTDASSKDEADLVQWLQDESPSSINSFARSQMHQNTRAQSADAFMELSGLENRYDECWLDSDKEMRVRDSLGVLVMYEAAMEDLQAMEWELLQIGTHYINQYEAQANRTISVDRVGVLADLFESEACFQEAKRRVVDCYLEAYEHVFDPPEQKRLAQAVINLLAKRPRLDLNAPYFAEAYASDIVCLELQAAFLREIITSQIADEKLILLQTVKGGDLADKNAAGLPDPLLNLPMQPVQLFVESSKVGLFDFFPSLAVLGRIPVLFKHVLNELVRVYKPQSPIALNALHRVLLQQAMVEWRLLLSEDRLQAAAQVNRSAANAPPPLSEPLIIEDFTALEIIVKQIATDDERSGKGLIRAAGGKVAKPGQIYVETLLLCLELVRLRNELTRALYETEVLTNIYKVQARNLGRDVGQTELRPIHFEHGLRRTEEELVEEPLAVDDEVSSASMDYKCRVAMAEIDPQLAVFDLGSSDAVKGSLTAERLEDLRRTYEVQVLHKLVLIIAIQYNQVSLDAVTSAMQAKELEEISTSDMPLSLLSKFGFTPRGPSSTFLTANSPGAGSPGRDSDVHSDSMTTVDVRLFNERMRKFREQELQQVAPCFLSVIARKVPIRNNLLSAYAERSSRFGSNYQAEIMNKKTKELKNELVAIYCSELFNDLYGFALKTQLVRLIEDITMLLAGLPNDAAPFVFSLGRDPDEFDDHIIEAQDRKDNLQETVIRKFFTRTGRLANLWYLPGFREILKVPKSEDHAQAVTDSLAALPILSSMHDILVFLRVHAQVGQPVAEYLRGPHGSGGMEQLAHELKRLKAELENLRSPTHPHDVALYLSEKRLVLFLKTLLAFRGISEQFMAQGNIGAWREMNRAIKVLLAFNRDESLYTTYLPLVEPSAVPQMKASFTACTAAPWAGDHIISPYHPVPLALLHIADADRNYVHNELTSIELLLEECLSEQQVYATSEPVRAVASNSHLLKMCLMRINLKHFYLRVAGCYPNSPPYSPEDCAAGDARYKVEIVSVAEVASAIDGQRVMKRSSTSNLREAEVNVLRIFIGLQLLEETVRSMERVYSTLSSEVEERMVHGTVAANQYSVKLGILQDFLNGIGSKAVILKEGGEAIINIKGKHLNHAIDDLAEALNRWGVEELRSQASVMHAANQYLRHLLFYNESKASFYERLRELDKRTLARRVDAEVTDRGYNLIFEVDSLKRDLADMKEASQHQEERIRDLVRGEYEEQIQQLTNQLNTKKTQFEEFRRNMFSDIGTNMTEVKRDAMMRMVQSAGGQLPGDFHVRQTAYAHMEDEVHSMRDQVNDLKNVLSRMKAMYHMRLSSLQTAHQHKVENLMQQRTEANKQMWMSREEVEQKMQVLRNELDDTRTQLTTATHQLDNLRKELQLMNRNKAALVQWKVTKARHMADLEAKVKKFERFRTLDIDKLIADLTRKEAQLKQLADIENRAEERAQLAQSSARKQVRKLRQQLMQEQRVKLDAFSKLAVLQGHDPWLAPLVLDSSLPLREEDDPAPHSYMSTASDALASHHASQHQPFGDEGQRPMSAPMLPAFPSQVSGSPDMSRGSASHNHTALISSVSGGASVASTSVMASRIQAQSIVSSAPPPIVPRSTTSQSHSPVDSTHPRPGIASRSFGMQHRRPASSFSGNHRL